MKRRIVSLVVAVVFLLSAVLGISGCGKSSETAVNSQPTVATTETQASTVEEKIDPLGKYETPVNITCVLGADKGQDTLPSGTTPDNNAFIDLCKEKLGINLKVLWSVPTNQYEQKLNITIASGTIPDIFAAGRYQFEQLLKADSIADISDTFDKYALPDVKYWVTSDGGDALAACKKDNKQYAIPIYNDVLDYVMLPFVRVDWLKNLNLPEPKTMDDLLKIAEAFTTQDPDKNGKNDTNGIGVCKDVIGWVFDLTGIFNAYHAYPNIWVKDNSGNLVYGSIQQEMKPALAKLQELYKNGVINKEFGVKDFNKCVEENTAGKYGIMYAQWYAPGWPLQQLIDKDRNADYKCFPNLSADDKPVLSQTEKVAINGYQVVSKNCKNPEALLKLINLFYDIENSPDRDAKYGQKRKPEGGYEWTWVPVKVYQSTGGRVASKELIAAAEAKDPSKISLESTKELYTKALKFLDEGDRSQWGTAFGTKPDSPRAIIGKLFDSNQIIFNEFYGSPTETMKTKDQTLKAKLIEGFSKIIMGSAPVDEFDNLVIEWKKLGGDQVTKEVNDWYATVKNK